MTDDNGQALAQLAGFCREAVERCGDHWESVCAYVAERVQGLPLEQRQGLERQLGRVLAYRPPDCAGGPHH